MTSRFAILCALPLLIAAAPPVSNENDPEPPYTGKVYKSPKAVFDAYTVAMQKKNYKVGLDCLTPESQQDLAAFSVYAMISIRKSSIVPEELKKAYKPVFEVMDEHGLTEKATADVEIEEIPLKLPEKARTALRKLIKKPATLMIDLTKASDKMDKTALGGAQAEAKTTLEELKIDGNKASGKIVTASNNFKMTQKVTFEKGKRGWRMAPALEYEPVFEAPQPPPIEKK